MLIRPANDRDLPALREIERATGQPFRDIGMAMVADDEPPSLETLHGYVIAGRAWLIERDEHPAAYLIADVVDDNVHIEQVSVHPDYAGKRYGRDLVEHVAGWAVEHGHQALTLTTFLDVPWNGPYYQRLGFRLLPPGQVTSGLQALREQEAAPGFDRWARGCLRRDL